MFGSYPYPGNLLENNTIEFINVYVKPGKSKKQPKKVKEANLIKKEEWIDLTQQVWFMIPDDVQRLKGHPAPFPEKLPARLIKMYTNGPAGGAGDSKSIKEILAVKSVLLPRNLISPTIEIVE